MSSPQIEFRHRGRKWIGSIIGGYKTHLILPHQTAARLLTAWKEEDFEIVYRKLVKAGVCFIGEIMSLFEMGSCDEKGKTRVELHVTSVKEKNSA